MCVRRGPIAGLVIMRRRDPPIQIALHIVHGERFFKLLGIEQCTQDEAELVEIHRVVTMQSKNDLAWNCV